MTRAQLLAQIADCRHQVAQMRKLYPGAVCWAVARLPTGSTHPADASKSGAQIDTTGPAA